MLVAGYGNPRRLPYTTSVVSLTIENMLRMDTARPLGTHHFTTYFISPFPHLESLHAIKLSPHIWRYFSTMIKLDSWRESSLRCFHAESLDDSDLPTPMDASRLRAVEVVRLKYMDPILFLNGIQSNPNLRYLDIRDPVGNRDAVQSMFDRLSSLPYIGHRMEHMQLTWSPGHLLQTAVNS
jgi:hypothetical protein